MPELPCDKTLQERVMASAAQSDLEAKCEKTKAQLMTAREIYMDKHAETVKEEETALQELKETYDTNERVTPEQHPPMRGDIKKTMEANAKALQRFELEHQQLLAEHTTSTRSIEQAI